MTIILIGLFIAIFVPFLYTAYLAYRDIRRWDEHHELREKYEPLMDRAENLDEHELLWYCFNKECEQLERLQRKFGAGDHE